VAIPPQPDDAWHGIVQRDYHFTSGGGIKITGLRIDVAPEDAYGTDSIYFDDMRAVTDLFAETSREPDDPRDDW
jgi:hypothetical protein